MKSREIIARIIARNAPPRLGCNFNTPYPSDIAGVAGARITAPEAGRAHLYHWGRHAELLSQVPDFNGEVCLDIFGNILGRFEGKTKGECIKGALEDGWEGFDAFELPKIDMDYYNNISSLKDSGLYVLAGAPFSVFSVLRDTRRMNNALTDVLLEPTYVAAFIGKVCARIEQIIPPLSRLGVDALIMGDDWGTQDHTFISPLAFADIFKPAYKRISDALHNHEMKFMLHSCGYNYEFMKDMIDAGIDVLQFDQLGLYGYERMAREFGHKVTFYSPLDIQKTLPTGDRALIEEQAHIMANAFRTVCAGSLIIKDYPSYADINVDEQWASWARDIFLANLEIN